MILASKFPQKIPNKKYDCMPYHFSVKTPHAINQTSHVTVSNSHMLFVDQKTELQ